MTTTTIKISINCDYLVYLNPDMEVSGYEISPDERLALSLRYNAAEESTATFPLSTIYILEVFGIPTTMVWMMENASNKGQLLFYKPNLLAFSKEITKTLDDALPIGDYSTTFAGEKKGSKFVEGKDFIKVPAVWHKKEEDLVNLDVILRSLPFVGWMETYWGTPIWIEIWRSKPELQRFMSGYAQLKMKEGEVIHNESDKLPS